MIDPKTDPIAPVVRPLQIDVHQTTVSDAQRLLAQLFQHGVHVSADGDTLRCSGATEVLQGALAHRIRALKPQIIAFLQQSTGAPTVSIPALNQPDPPLSPAQKRLWVLEHLDPDTAHHIPFALEARGTLDRDALRDSLLGLTRRHTVLRQQIFHDATTTITTDTPAPITTQDVRTWDDASLDALIEADFKRPFDLATAPPLRVHVLHRAPDLHILLFTLHHIAADGSSIDVLMRDFAALYGEAVAGFAADLPDLSIQYGDYAVWHLEQETSPERAAQLTFWQSKLGRDLPVTRLPTDHARPTIQSLAGTIHPFEIDEGLSNDLRALGIAQGTTVFTVLFAAFAVLVHRYCLQQDLIIGTPSANRSMPDLDGLVGLFVNPLPIRCTVDPQQGFDTIVKSIHRDLLDAQTHQDVPFEHLVDRFQIDRDPGASPLFQLKFQLDRAPRETMDLPGLKLSRRAFTTRTARHDLSLNLTEGRAFTGHFEYATALFDAATIDRLAGHFRGLLGAIVRTPGTPVGHLEYLPVSERKQLLETWNDTQTPLDPALRFAQIFEAHAANQPGAIAVHHVSHGADATLTYDALNARANQLAHALRDAGAGPETIVAIALDRGPDQVAAWLGVLKSGAAYLPLDPAYPHARLDVMLQDSGASILLTSRDFPQIDGPKRWDLDTHWPQGPRTNPTALTNPDDLAYVIYTSGSTGRPKGVEITHAGLANLTLDKLRRCDVTPSARVFGFFSFSFDASIPDLIMSLGGGATLLTASVEDVLPGPRMAHLLRDHRATHLTITPSALAHVPSDDLPDLRMVLVGGEAPSRALITTWSEGRIFINAYGPTECTVNASMVLCGNGHPTTPALQAPANKQLHVLDRNAQLLPIGCPGELCIGGIGLARGYRGLPDKTAQVFIPDPFRPAPARVYRSGDLAVRLHDGRIRVLGRIDDQIKVRGFRVEPGEIARCCEAVPGVSDAVVIARDIKGVQRLVAYLVADGARRDQTALREALKTELPRHMIPDAIVWMDALPLTINGKLDVTALPHPTSHAPHHRAPETETETALAAIFTDLLGVGAPDTQADFFDLGGTSLIATRLVAAIEDRFHHKLRALALFEGASIQALAARIDGTYSTTPVSPWQNDLDLDETLRPPNLIAVPAHLPDCILMTGATGFVGAHILAELLTNPTQHVICLTRGDSAAKVEQALRQYDLWMPAFDHQITAISGDLAAAGLGLDANTRAHLAGTIGAVVHCGAQVHHLTPYTNLRQTNVTGTVEIMRMCCDLGVPLHYVSTLSALTPGDAPLDETAGAATRPAPDGGYNQSKWVAEQLVSQAAARGLPVTTYRLGSIGPSMRTGAYNRADILVRQVQGYVASGRAPAGDARINLLPVDYLARAVCHLAATPDHSGRVFHMQHAVGASSDVLFDALAKAGVALTRVPAHDWQTQLAQIARTQPDHPLYPLAALGGPQGFTGAVWPYACPATRTALTDLPEPDLTPDTLRTALAAVLTDAPIRTMPA
ncbi:amino acid adenylation domain-containing protein [Roseobacter sp.]|uniref:non-ribosomal peptide synthetase n=1 Tax=Roseobacter sp. TaxID=1907202 RepID=UPI00329915C5